MDFATSALGRAYGHACKVRGMPRFLYASYAKGEPPPGDRVDTTTYGDLMRVDLTSRLEWIVWAFGTYEPTLGRLLGDHINKGDVVIDIGANVGIHTIRMASLAGPTGRVHAYEPLPDLCDRLQANLDLNDFDHVEVHRRAVGAAAGEMHLHLPSGRNKGVASVLHQGDLHGTVTLDVPVAPIAHMDRVDFIKVDVEGSEREVFDGIADLIREHRPKIVFEHCLKFTTVKGSPFKMLIDMGYNIFEIRSRRPLVTGSYQLDRRLDEPDTPGDRNLFALPHVTAP